MKIGFFNNSESLNLIDFSNYADNPGIGGTEYVTMRILYDLAAYYHNDEFYLVTARNIINQTTLPNLHIAHPRSVSLDVCVIANSHFKEFEKIPCSSKRNIIWSHHPHDELDDSINEAVFLGDYHLYSNGLYKCKKYIIKNPAPRINLKISNRDISPNKFVYLGAIGPAKGLHHILKFWPKIREIIPAAQLSVIGGDLYSEGLSTNESDIPVSGKYGHKLSKILYTMKKEDSDSVTFHGLVAAGEKHQIMSNSHIGLLNPTGKSEAAPASPLECYSHGVPVIAAGDYGAFDNMRYFPELDLKKRRLKNILTYISDSANFLKMSERSYNYSKSLYAMNGTELKKWYDLFNEDIGTDMVSLPRDFKLKITLRDKFLRMIKYPIRRIIR
jgi:glycosyltransferase involved in cell wall biosynthesis